jgi:hypothetical protein
MQIPQTSMNCHAFFLKEAIVLNPPEILSLPLSLYLQAFCKQAFTLKFLKSKLKKERDVKERRNYLKRI